MQNEFYVLTWLGLSLHKMTLCTLYSVSDNCQACGSDWRKYICQVCGFQWRKSISCGHRLSCSWREDSCGEFWMKVMQQLLSCHLAGQVREFLGQNPVKKPGNIRLWNYGELQHTWLIWGLNTLRIHDNWNISVQSANYMVILPEERKVYSWFRSPETYWIRCLLTLHVFCDSQMKRVSLKGTLRFYKTRTPI